MISPKKVKKIEQALKEFFWRDSEKSTNKAYLAPGNTADRLDLNFNANEVYNMGWETGKLQAKAFYKYQKVVRAGLLAQQQGNAPGNQTFWAWGQAALNSGTRPQQRWGNCTEMAIIAGVIAHERFQVTKDWIYIVEMARPADHAFCVISNPQPTWGSIAELRPGARPDGAYVLDLWLDTFCLASCYFGEAQAHLQKWAGQSKRITWDSPATGPGWYFPTGTYKTAFDGAALVIRPIDSRLQ